MLPPKGDNLLSANARLVFSLLAHKRTYGRGLSLEKIGSHLGMAAHHGAKNAIAELKASDLVRLEDRHDWHAVGERPVVFAERGFIKIYLLKKRRHGTVISNLDNVALWVLFHLQKTKWKWPKNRSAVLARMLGIDRHNVSRQLGRLKSLGLIDDKWIVQAERIDPDWFRDQDRSEDQKFEPWVEWPSTGNGLWDDLLNSLDLLFEKEGVERKLAMSMASQLIDSGCLGSLKNYVKVEQIKTRIWNAKAVDPVSIKKIIEEVVEPSIAKAEPHAPVRESVAELPGPRAVSHGFGRLDLEALSEGGDFDTESDAWLQEFALDDAAA